MKFCKVLSSDKRYFQALRDNYLEGGGRGWKIRGGAYEKMTTRETGLDVKFNTYGGGGSLQI